MGINLLLIKHPQLIYILLIFKISFANRLIKKFKDAETYGELHRTAKQEVRKW